MFEAFMFTNFELVFCVTKHIIAEKCFINDFNQTFNWKVSLKLEIEFRIIRSYKIANNYSIYD